MDLNETANCTLGEECATCGSGVDLDVVVVDLDLPGGGVGCCTLCRDCIEEQRAPRLGVPDATSAAMGHCEHLGITVDEMAVLLEAESLSG